MSPRQFKPFKPFKNSKKSPFDHDGPSQKALKDALDWIATHDPNTPFSKLINEVRLPAVPARPGETGKPVPPPAEQAPVLVPDESVESATSSVEPALPADLKRKPEENTNPEEVAGALPSPSEGGPAEGDEKTKEVAGEPPSMSEDGPSTEYDEESEEIASQIRSFLRPPQRLPINSRRVRRIDDDDPANLSRHRRLCMVCHHEDKFAIEQAFLEWRRPSDIKREFHLADQSSIYRHARATGLFEKRARNLRSALEKVMEESTARPPSADSIIRAVRVYGCLDASGRWVEPPRNLIITHHTSRPPQPHGSLPAPEPKKLINVDPAVLELEKDA